MDIQEAQSSIQEISSAKRKAAELINYRDSGSVISVWGVIWLTGFTVQQFYPSLASLVWAIGWVGAIGWTMTRPKRPGDGKAMITWFIVVAYITLLLIIISADARTISVIFAVVLSASYAVMGVWLGKRFFLLAGIVAMTICLGWWWVSDWLYAVLAFGGGGALIAGGLWLKQP